MIYCALGIRKEYALQIRNAIDVFTTDFPVAKKMVKIVALYKKYFSVFLEEFGWGYMEIKEHMGGYAANDPWEMLPECFNNYYRLKAKDKLSIVEEETYEFVKRIVDDYRRYIPQKL